MDSTAATRQAGERREWRFSAFVSGRRWELRGNGLEPGEIDESVAVEATPQRGGREQRHYIGYVRITAGAGVIRLIMPDSARSVTIDPGVTWLDRDRTNNTAPVVFRDIPK